MTEHQIDILKQSVIRRMDTIDGLANAGLRSLTLINGGALVALFTLVAQGAGSPFVQRLDVSLIVFAAFAFVAGLVCSIVATLFGYLGQQILHMSDQGRLHTHLGIDQMSLETANREIDKGNRCVGYALWAAILSLVGFIVGAVIALAAALAAGAA